MNDEQLKEALRYSGVQRREHRRQAQEQSDALKRLVLLASERGMTDAEIVRLALVDKMTVRKWLGK